MMMMMMTNLRNCISFSETPCIFLHKESEKLVRMELKVLIGPIQVRIGT